jgi:hypothetical protein
MSGQQRENPAFCRLEICAWVHGFADQQSILSPALQRTKLNTYWTASRLNIGETRVKMTKLAWEFTHGSNADSTAFLRHRSGSNLFGSKLACPSQTYATYMNFLIYGRGPSSILFFRQPWKELSLFKLNLGLDFCAICVAHAMSVVVCVSNFLDCIFLSCSILFVEKFLHCKREREREREREHSN